MVKLPVNSTWPLPKERQPDMEARDRVLARSFLMALTVRVLSPAGTKAWYRLKRAAE